jgi:hypothetical protein
LDETADDGSSIGEDEGEAVRAGLHDDELWGQGAGFDIEADSANLKLPKSRHCRQLDRQ